MNKSQYKYYLEMKPRYEALDLVFQWHYRKKAWYIWRIKPVTVNEVQIQSLTTLDETRIGNPHDILRQFNEVFHDPK